MIAWPLDPRMVGFLMGMGLAAFGLRRRMGHAGALNMVIAHRVLLHVVVACPVLMLVQVADGIFEMGFGLGILVVTEVLVVMGVPWHRVRVRPATAFRMAHGREFLSGAKPL